MAEMLTITSWHGNRFPLGGYGWNSTGVVVMSERHPDEEHPMRGPEEQRPPAGEPAKEDAPEEKKEEEEKKE